MHVCVVTSGDIFPQNASIDGSQVNGILAIVIHTVNYLTERRVISQIVWAVAGREPRLSVMHECLSWNGSFLGKIGIQILGQPAIDTDISM